MAITTEELRKWISEDRRHGVNINSGVLNDISAELITARAKLEAAEKLAEAARYFYEYGEKDRDLLSAIRAWEAVK